MPGEDETIRGAAMTKRLSIEGTPATGAASSGTASLFGTLLKAGATGAPLSGTEAESCACAKTTMPHPYAADCHPPTAPRLSRRERAVLGQGRALPSLSTRQGRRRAAREGIL